MKKYAIRIQDTQNVSEFFYNPLQVSLKYLLSLYYEVINPTSINRQGGDTGTQYRTGIYYVEQQDLATIKASIAELQTHYEKPIAIEVLPLQNYYIAEEYHQKYLDKNPNGYCHIGVDKFEHAKQAKEIPYSKIQRRAQKAFNRRTSLK